jgi:hypothetical protein
LSTDANAGTPAMLKSLLPVPMPPPALTPR